MLSTHHVSEYPNSDAKPSSNLVLSRLETIHFDGADFRPRVGLSFERLLTSLQERKAANLGIKTFHLVNCLNTDQVIVKKFKSSVERLIWDGFQWEEKYEYDLEPDSDDFDEEDREDSPPYDPAFNICGMRLSLLKLLKVYIETPGIIAEMSSSRGRF